MTRLPHSLLLALGLLLASCSSNPFEPGEPDGAWVESEVQAPSERTVREVLSSVLSDQFDHIGQGYDPVERRMETGWRTSLSPFKSRGYRVQGVAEWERVEAGRYLVRLRVKRQTNENLAKPLDPAQAEWRWSADDELLAREALHHVVAHFPPDLSVDEPEDPEARIQELLNEPARRLGL